MEAFVLTVVTMPLGSLPHAAWSEYRAAPFRGTRKEGPGEGSQGSSLSV